MKKTTKNKLAINSSLVKSIYIIILPFFLITHFSHSETDEEACQNMFDKFTNKSVGSKKSKKLKEFYKEVMDEASIYKEKESEIFVEDIDIQAMLETFIATQPKNTIDQEQMDFLHLYTSSSDFRIWFVDLQTLLDKTSELKAGLRKDINISPQSIVKETKPSAWKRNFILYMKDPLFVSFIKAFQQFLANYHRHQEIKEKRTQEAIDHVSKQDK